MSKNLSMNFRKDYTSGEHALSLAEVKLLFDSCESLKELAMWKLAISAGLRRSDLAAVRWKDVNFKQGFIEFYEKKKDRIKRTYLNKDTLTTLKRLKNSQDNEYYLFPGRVDVKYGKGHISSRAIYDKFQSALVRAGLQGEDDRTPVHALRATCVKLCQARGWSPSKTAKHLGDTVNTIQKHYATPSDSEMSEVVNEKGLW